MREGWPRSGGAAPPAFAVAPAFARGALWPWPDGRAARAPRRSPAVTELHKRRIRRDDRDMKVPASPSGDQLIQDYLTRVAAAARLLPKGARIAFVGRTKAQIERE